MNGCRRKNSSQPEARGIIAVESREHTEFFHVFAAINDPAAFRSLAAERLVLKRLGAGCTGAVGVYSYSENGSFHIKLMKGTENGSCAGRSPERLRNMRPWLRRLRRDWIMNKGMVFLVGAGPGDPGLLTLRGKELLETAGGPGLRPAGLPGVFGAGTGGLRKDLCGQRIRPSQQDPGGDQRDPGGVGVKGKAGDPFEGRRSLCLWPGRRRSRAFLPMGSP